MSDTKPKVSQLGRFDRPCEHLAAKDATHAPWASDAARGERDTAGHRRYHGLYEDLMN